MTKEETTTAVKKIVLKTDKLVLVKLTIGWWRGSHVAHGLENDVASEQDGEASAFKVHLKCMPPEYRSQLSAVSSQMDRSWKHASRPYEDGGWRIMRADRYGDLMNKVNLMAAERRQIVDSMIRDYDAVASYAKKALGKSYKEGMVPPTNAIKSMFDRTWLRPKPIGNAADARLLNVAKETQEAIEQQMQEQISEAQTALKADIKDGIGRFVKDLMARLDGHKKRNGSRYGSLLNSLGKAAKELREMGLIEEADPIFEQAEELAKTSPKDIRKHKGIRKAVKRELEDIDSKIEAAFA